MTTQIRSLSMLEMSARSLVPAGVTAAVTAAKGDAEPLWPAEEDAMQHASPARQREFAAGRMAARRALLGSFSICSPQGIFALLSRNISAFIVPLTLVGEEEEEGVNSTPKAKGKEVWRSGK